MPSLAQVRYTSYVVQDLMITPHVVKFRRERWQTVNGETMTAPLPAGISGHFGPELRRFVLYNRTAMTFAPIARSYPLKWSGRPASSAVSLSRPSSLHSSGDNSLIH
jgi:hypothetical protein